MACFIADTLTETRELEFVQLHARRARFKEEWRLLGEHAIQQDTPAMRQHGVTGERVNL